MRYKSSISLTLFTIGLNTVSCSSSISQTPTPHSQNLAPLAESDHTQKTSPTTSDDKHDFMRRIHRAWKMPINSSGKKATATVILSNSGAVLGVVVNSSDPQMKESIMRAIPTAAPYPMPTDPELRKKCVALRQILTLNKTSMRLPSDPLLY